MSGTLIKLLPTMGYISYIALIVLLIGINLYYGPKITTDKVPMQWDLRGNPTWYGGKIFGLWMPFTIFVLVGSVLIYKARQFSAEPVVWDWVILIGYCVFCLAVHAWHISAIAAWAAKQG